MSIVLPPVRYHDANSPYHYTEDNKPLQDLALRDTTLQTAIETATQTTKTGLAVGNWVGLVVPLDFSTDINKPFALKVRTWAIQDQSVSSTQNATFAEDLLMGYVALNGTINVLSTTNTSKIQQGAAVLTYSFTPSGTSLNMSFSGYVGTNAYVLVRAERFGP